MIIATPPASAPKKDQGVILPTVRRLAFLSAKSAGRTCTQINVTSEAANCTSGKESSAAMMPNPAALAHAQTQIATVNKVRTPQYHPTTEPPVGDFHVGVAATAPIKPPDECRQQQQQQPPHRR